MTVKCVYIRIASPATPRFTLCTTGTLRNPDGSIDYHSGWYNSDNTYQYTWKGSDCTNGLPQQGASAIGIAVGSATNGGGGLQGGNCLPSGAQHYNDPDWAGYTTGQMRCLFENNATSPYIITNPCGIGTFPHDVELSADGGQWCFLMNAFAGCGCTAVATVDWLIPDQSAGTGGAVLTFGVNVNTTVSPRTGGIQVCGTDPVLCGTFVVVQTPYSEGQPFCGGYCPGADDTPPPPPPPPVGTFVYYQTDAIGSVRMTTDDNQQVTRYDYWPFGEQSPAGGAPTNPRMFTGAERDSSTNTSFDYLGARYYAGLFGRFTTPDPITENQLRVVDPQRWNRYTYAVNNPLTYNDPEGLDAILVNYVDGAHGLGHIGVMSLNPDGSGLYGGFEPAVRGSFRGAGSVNNESFPPGSVVFGPEGPTLASRANLRKWLAAVDGKNPRSVRIHYIKTSKAVTAALELHIKQSISSSGWYNGLANNCLKYVCNTMRASGISPPPPSAGGEDPNAYFDLFFLDSREQLLDLAQQLAQPLPTPKAETSTCFQGIDCR